MNPLSEAIYRILVKRTNGSNPLITYSQLVNHLPPLQPPYNALTHNDKRLFEALGEVGTFCQQLGLPSLTAMVVRGSDQFPGKGYFIMFHPDLGDNPILQKELWVRDLEQMKTVQYPDLPGESKTTQPIERTSDPRKSTQLGNLHLSDHSRKSSTLFTGIYKCSSCRQSLEIEVERNQKAVQEKQPAFSIVRSGSIQDEVPLGHLFIGTILTSPALYYGTIKHCEHEQRITIFFNRAMRDRTDAILLILASTSGQRATQGEEGETFELR